MKVILFNGPPRSGKDECAKILIRHRLCYVERFSNPLKRTISALLDRSMSDLEETKDEKLYFDNKCSYRDLQIWLSEECMKPKFGQRVFGWLLGERLLRVDTSLPSYVIIPDSGFEAELFGLEDTGAWDIRVIRIERPGRTFDGDSRSYLPHPDYTIFNDGTLEDLETELMSAIKDIER